MDSRAAKLALARKKLKDHQEKKTVQKDDNVYKPESNTQTNNSVSPIQEFNSHNVAEIIIDPKLESVSDIVDSASSVPYIDNAVPLVECAPTPVDYNQTNLLQEPRIPTQNTSDINVAEMLISNKRNLELQIHDLQMKLIQMEHNHALVINDFKLSNQRVNDLENELQNINNKYLHATEELSMKDVNINQLNAIKTTLSEENSNLQEQLEFTKTVLNSKEAENDSLNTHLKNFQNQYEVIHLQLQQLTNGTPASPPNDSTIDNEKYEALLQKTTALEQKLNLMQKEREQMTLHYEHYVAELNEQLQTAISKNERFDTEIQELTNRENSLIDHISDMEIRLQQFSASKKQFEMDQNASNINVLQENLRQAQEGLNELQLKYQQLEAKYVESEAKVKGLSEQKEAECNHDNISITKLSADMTSDKVAAQRATEQNKKLKQDVQGLEDAFVKMSNDKLELTEKLTAEKYLNRELTIKLAEIDERAKEMQIKLKAKDEEMIRLQASYREIEKQWEQHKDLDQHNSTTVEPELAKEAEENFANNNDIGSVCNSESEHKHLTDNEDCKHSHTSHGLHKEDAMSKLQERFLKIMGEVADLSDEKHRLEHIILQLQNETDTICEYVALYQQQRSLLKRRDEERTAQLKVFQQECGKLKRELEELSEILARFADDKELLSYFQVESRRTDMERVMSLLTNLKNNYLIDERKKHLEFKNFYPCNCCSGELIDV